MSRDLTHGAHRGLLEGSRWFCAPFQLTVWGRGTLESHCWGGCPESAVASEGLGSFLASQCWALRTLPWSRLLLGWVEGSRQSPAAASLRLTGSP